MRLSKTQCCKPPDPSELSELKLFPIMTRGMIFTTASSPKKAATALFLQTYHTFYL